PSGRDARRDLEGRVEIVRLDEDEAAEVLFRIHERPIREKRLSVLDAHGGRGLDRLQLLASDHTGRLTDGAVVADDRVLFVRGQPRELIGVRVDLEQVLHGVLLLERVLAPTTNVHAGRGHHRDLTPGADLVGAMPHDHRVRTDLPTGTVAFLFT